MSDTSQIPVIAPETVSQPTNGPASAEADFAPQWADTSPRGGRTVLNRVLKDGQKVPMFMGQTLVNSLRDLGYNNTTSALCEHVDNAIQWGATEVRIYFHQTGKQPDQRIDILVLDNGQGMAPHVLKVATSFGGSMVYDNRSGIGRYGMGMKTAALHLSKVLDVYSWQESGAFYNMTLDVEEIGNSRHNMIEMEDPTLCNELPSDIVDIVPSQRTQTGCVSEQRGENERFLGCPMVARADRLLAGRVPTWVRRSYLGSPTRILGGGRRRSA